LAERVRSIIHLDLDAFFAAVEVLENPGLAGKPLIVGGRADQRGVVATASYRARDFGVRSAMPTYRALELCPEAVVLPPRHGLYREYSQQVMAILHRTSPLVEQMSIDEAYLDLTDQIGSWEGGIETARALQRWVKDDVGLPASLGVATNKLVAKVACDRDKPEGLTVVRPGEEAAFLAPLPVRVLWGVGPVTAERLARIGVTTVGDLARIPEEQLRARFGSHGTEMAYRARGIDGRKLCTEHERKSVGQERTFGHDLVKPRALKSQLWSLSQGVAEHLERHGVAAGTVAIKVRYADFTTFTRQMQLMVATDDAQTIYRAALVLLGRAWERGRPVRLLGVAGRDLVPPSGQLRLPLPVGNGPCDR
jgi:DNA polymerase-4